MNKKIIFTLLISVFLLACTKQLQIPLELIDDDLIVLSDTDYKTDGNRFLSQQIEESSEIYQFFKIHSAPAAYKIVGSYIGPIKLYLFYPKYNQAFLAISNHKQTITKWEIVPASPEVWDMYKDELIAFDDQYYPVFLVWDTEINFKNPVILNDSKNQSFRQKVQSEKKSYGKTVTYTNKEAIRFKDGLAEKTFDGHLIHRVKVASERLEDIANWYTGNIKMPKKMQILTESI